MAEALGLASSIVALVQLSASVYSAISKFYREAKDAKLKVGALATQARNLSGVLQNLSLLASWPLFDDVGVSIPDLRDTCIESCYTTLHRIKRKLEKAECDFDTGSRRKLIARSLKWPFATQETNDLVAELSHHQDALQLALSSDTMFNLLQCLANTNSIIKSTDSINRKLERKMSIDIRAKVTEKREKIVQFFLKVNPEEHLQDYHNRRQPCTGRWLIERNQTFRNWMASSGSQIWLSGIPGAGKTMLCGTVAEEMLQNQAPSKAVAFFFCNYNYMQSQEPVTIIAALAVQLAKQADAAFELLESYHAELHPDNRVARPPETKRIIEVVRAMIDQYDVVYLAVDGIDECGSNVVEVLRSLKQLASGRQVNLALFSRDEPDIKEELQNSPHIRIAAHTEDLELYVLAQMESRRKLANLAVKNPELHEHIRRTLIEGANGMFRWVSCQLDHLDRLSNDARRRKALTELPPTLFETYDRILDRIMQEDEHDQEACRKALHWTGLGYRNFHSLALCEAISIPDDQDLIDEELLVEPDWVSRSCSSLIRLAHQETDYPHFELAHFTVKEYLRSIKPQSTRKRFRFSEDMVIRDFMGTSLRFLTFPIFDRMPTTAASEIQQIAKRNDQHPFYPFAASSLVYRGDDCRDDTLSHELSSLLEKETMMSYAKHLFSPEKKGTFLSWVLQLAWCWPETIIPLNEVDLFRILGLLLEPEFSSLHMAAMLALPSICTHLIDNHGVDLNACGRLGTPLHALLAGISSLRPTYKFCYDPYIHYRKHSKPRETAHDQYRECLQILLDRGANTSLRWNGAGLIEMAINCSVMSPYGWISPLIVSSTVVDDRDIAALEKNMGYGLINRMDRSIVDAIYSLGSNPNAASRWALLASFIQMYRMEDRDHEGGGHPPELQDRVSDADVVKGIQISLVHNLTDTLRVFVQDPRFRPDMLVPYYDSAPKPILHVAIRATSLESVKILLKAGCDPKTVHESNGWTALHECAIGDSDDGAITALLLESGALDSVRNDLGSTCWHFAAELGNTTVLKVLIAMGSDTKQSLATVSSASRTPLAEAINRREVTSALLLLDYCGAESKFFQSDQSLLNAAASIGSKDLFIRLYEKLKQAGASDTIDSSTPLDHIDMFCSAEIVDYLIDCWGTSGNGNSGSLTAFLLHANDAVFDEPGMCPSHTDIDHIIRKLLQRDYTFVDHEKVQQQFWETFCRMVVPHFKASLTHAESRRSRLINMIFDILIGNGVLASYEQNLKVPGYKVFFRSLLDRNDHLNCSWIAPSVHKVIEAHISSGGLSNEAVCIELLSQAVRRSNIDLVQELLNSGVDVHTAHGYLTPLEQACYSSDLSTFRMVLENSDKTRINRIGSQGKSLLHWVVSGYATGYLEKIEWLLQLHVSIDAVVDDANGDTALTLAARADRQDIVAVLVSRGANILHCALDERTVLHAAAITGDLRYIHPLIPTETPSSFWVGGCDMYMPSYDLHVKNVTAIHLAAGHGRSRFLEDLMQMQVPFDANAVTGYPMFTPLHLASMYGHLEVVEILLALTDNINQRDALGNRAIDIAATNQHNEIFQRLLEAGSEPPSSSLGNLVVQLMSKESECAEDAGNSTAMSQFYFEKAIMHGNLECCKELVEKGQSINAELLTTSYTPLLRAVVEGQTVVVDWLISRGVEVTTPTFEWVHPSYRSIAALSTLYLASSQTLTAVLSLALEQNVIWYGGGSSPLHVAIWFNKVDLLNAILTHIRENENAYRKMIEVEMIRLPGEVTDWRNRSPLSTLVNEFNQPWVFCDKESSERTEPPGWPHGPPLHWAIRQDNVSAVRLLLRHEADVNQVDSVGNTPLYLASSLVCSRDILRELLKAGAGAAHRIEAIWAATSNGDFEVIEILAEADPESLKAADLFSSNGLLYHARSVEVFQYLLSQDISLSRHGAFPFPAITLSRDEPRFSRVIFNSGLLYQANHGLMAGYFAYALYSGDFRAMGMIRRTAWAGNFTDLLNDTMHGGPSPLCVASSRNAIEEVEAFIKMGAELDFEGSHYGSPLMTACALGSFDVVKCLVRSGAVLCYVNSHGLLRSAVSLSCQHKKVMRWLLVDRHVEQQRLEHHASRSTSHQAVWSGPRPFKLALPAYMHRDFGESRWSHLRRLQKWKEGLIGATLAESRNNSGLDFHAEREAESMKRAAQVAHRRFLESLGELWCE